MYWWQASRTVRSRGEDKVRIIVESFKPGANVSEVARRNGLSPQQLFAWRREAQALFTDSGDAEPGKDAAPGDTPVFTPVVIASAAPASPSSPSRPSDPGTIEVRIGDAIVRVTGHVETSSLIAVLRAVRRSS